MDEKIIFNGRAYRSEAEMPSNVREAYNRINKFFMDANQDGIPDFIQQGGLAGIKDVFTFVKDLSKSAQSGQAINPDQFTVIRISDQNINVNGRQYKNVDEMPSEIRQAYERIISEVDPSEFEIYEEPWRETERQEYFQPHDDELLRPKSQSLSSSPVIETVNSNSRLVVILLAALAVLCIGAAIWLFFSGVI
jgi:hypothetical protein